MPVLMSTKKFKEICRSTIGKHESWYMKNVARRVSIWVTRVLALTPITANQVTFLSIVIMAASGAAAWGGSIWFRSLAPILPILAAAGDY